MLHIHVLNCDLAAFIRSIVPSTKSGQTNNNLKHSHACVYMKLLIVHITCQQQT